MIQRYPRRPGVTLMEVLIATGILAVGMLAIMALFPIGAVSMARAINQNRCADHAANSDTVFRYYWKKAWLDTNGGVLLNERDAYNNPRSPGEDMILLLGRRAIVKPIDFNIPPDIPPQSSQPSFAVLVDPIGYHTQLSRGLAWRHNIDGQASLPVRCSLATAETDPLPRTRIRLTTLLDDFAYDVNGEPANYTGQLERGGRYNTAWLIQRPRNNVPYDVHLTVLVYAGRSPTDTPSPEQAFHLNYVPASGDSSVVFNLNGQAKPAVHKGGWVALSMTIIPPSLDPPPGTGIPYQTLDLYRVVAIDEQVPDQLGLELEQPLKAYAPGTIATDFTIYPPPKLVFFDNLYEVFDRGIVSAASISGR